MASKNLQSQQKYALLSVFEKKDIVGFAKLLKQLGYTIISTGGTAKILKENNITVTSIHEVTGNPESFGGRMKTISFQIEAGILYDRNNSLHRKQAKELGIKPIDIVVCNLYPFEKTIQDPKVSLDSAIENIDVGGPTMVRAAAKNFKNVLIIVDPKDYQKVAQALQDNTISFAFRQKLSAKAFAHLSLYDSQIARYLESDSFPQEITVPGQKVMDLRYGENPHQKAAMYLEPNTHSPLKYLRRRVGRELSLVNITDINAGIESLSLFTNSAAVVIKHNTPCGLALGKTAFEALDRAIQADPESAFGGVIVLNHTMDLKAAKIIAAFKDARRGNIDIVAAAAITKEALFLLQSIRKTMGVYTFGRIAKSSFSRMNYKWINGGFIVQTDDDVEKGFINWKVVTEKKPTAEQIKQMKIAWKFISRIRSNAIIVMDSTLPMTRGIGTGQTSRVRATRIALEQAGVFTKGAILASDSFFPFDDSVKLAEAHSIGAIVQQGGSINDSASIAAANHAGIPMVMTNVRAFWH